MFLKMIFSYFLLFVILPMLVIHFHKEDRGWIDRLFICLIHSSFFFIIVIHLLSFIKLYETISLITVSFLGMFLIYKIQTSNQSISKGTILLVTGMELLDGRNDLKRSIINIKVSIASNIKKSTHAFLNSLKKRWFIWLSLVMTLGFAAYLRFKHATTYLYFGASDPYVHLRFSKYLGNNDIFGSGVYPYGFPAVISALHKFFNMDPYIVVRFIGPLAGMLMVLSIFFALRKIIGAHYPIIFFSIFIYVVYSEMPTNLWRQISALSMEYAAIFLLPGIALLIEYMRKRQMVYLLLAGECLLLTVIIHPYTAVTLGSAYIVICLGFWRVMLLPKVFNNFLKIMIVSGIVGVMPLVIGYLTAPIELEYFNESMQAPKEFEFSNWVEVILSSNILIMSLSFFSLLLLLYTLYNLWKNRRQKLNDSYVEPASISMVCIFILYYLIYRSGELGLPVLIPADRFGVFFSLVSAVVCGVLLKTILFSLSIFRNRVNLVNSLIYMMAGAILISGNINSAPVGLKYQYEDSLKMYFQIKKEFSPLEWTVISPGEDFSIILGYGRHTPLWEFVQYISNPEGKKFAIPTHDIFIFVEKIPLGTNNTTTEDEAYAPFPKFDDTDLTEFYYYDIKNRRILEAKIYKWAENYMESNDNMTIYYDSSVMRVYRLHQEEPLKNPVDFIL